VLIVVGPGAALASRSTNSSARIAMSFGKLACVTDVDSLYVPAVGLSWN
jgi:hypothetical protein